MRDPGTGLLGNTLHTDHAEWLRKDSGIGAGIDSFYEYLLKVGAQFSVCTVVTVWRTVLAVHVFWALAPSAMLAFPVVNICIHAGIVRPRTVPCFACSKCGCVMPTS